MSLYDIFLIGDGVPGAHAAVRKGLEEAIDKLGIPRSEAAFLGAPDAVRANRRRPSVAVFFGPSTSPDDSMALAQLQAREVPLLPAVAELDHFQRDTPAILHNFNGSALGADLSGVPALVSAALEWVGLLRRQRRLFLSYRRHESRDAAIGLYERLLSAGFDVFLDTHDIRPGDDFQPVLMNRLTDCEVVVLFDTPDFLNSRWTSEELARANLLGIAILQIVWPGHVPPRRSPLSSVHQLQPADVIAHTGPLSGTAANAIVREVEALRAEALAFRTAALAGEFIEQVGRLGGTVVSLPNRTLRAAWPDGREIFALPAVGVPAADRYHDAFVAAQQRGDPVPYLVYDEIGVLARWMGHLDWLDQHLPIQTLKVADIMTRLA